MGTYAVTVRAVYVQEFEIRAVDEAEAKTLALKQFEPVPDDLFSIDVFGLDPWRPIDGREDYAHDIYKQKELDDEA